jgi:AcrR family transcriptional regulator
MSRTQIGRSAFYVYFKDIYAAVEELLIRIRDAELNFLTRWAGQESDPMQNLETVVRNTVNLWVEHGPIISAMMDAAATDARIESAFNELTSAYSEVVASSLRREQAAGRIREMHCEEVADLLVEGTQSYLRKRLGVPDPDSDATVLIATLLDTWSHAVFGQLPD